MFVIVETNVIVLVIVETEINVIDMFFNVETNVIDMFGIVGITVKRPTSDDLYAMVSSKIASPGGVRVKWVI